MKKKGRKVELILQDFINQHFYFDVEINMKEHMKLEVLDYVYDR